MLGLFLRALPATLYLTFASLFVATPIAVPIGVLAVLKHNSRVDNLLTVLVLIGISLPHFWLGMLLVMLFSINLGWLPAQGSLLLTAVLIMIANLLIDVDYALFDPRIRYET